MKIILALAFFAVSVFSKIDASKWNFTHMAIDLESSTTNAEVDAIQHRFVKNAKSKIYSSIGKHLASTKTTVSEASKVKTSSTGNKKSSNINLTERYRGAKAKGNAAAKSNKYPFKTYSGKSKAYSSSIGKNSWSLKASMPKSPQIKTGNKWTLKYSSSKKYSGSMGKGNAGLKSTKYPHVIHNAKSKAYGKSSWSTRNPQAPKSKKAGHKKTSKLGPANKHHGPWSKGKYFKSTKHPKIKQGGKSKKLKGPKAKKGKSKAKKGKSKAASPSLATKTPTKNPNRGPQSPPIFDPATPIPSNSSPTSTPSCGSRQYTSSKKRNKYPTKSSSGPYCKGKGSAPAASPHDNNGPSKGGVSTNNGPSKGGVSTNFNPSVAPTVKTNSGPGAPTTKGNPTLTKNTKLPGSSKYNFPRTVSISVSSKDKKAQKKRGVQVLASVADSQGENDSESDYYYYY